VKLGVTDFPGFPIVLRGGRGSQVAWAVGLDRRPMTAGDTTEVLPRTPEEGGQGEASGEFAVTVAPPQLAPGTLLGARFRLVRHVATGGMGSVFEAFDEVLRVRVALKVFRARDGEGENAGRLEREVRLARRVSHPNVLRVFEFFSGTETEPQFLTMEFLEGETLRERLGSNGRMSPEEALPLVRQMVAGLAAAHAEGVVHRDLKPSNVFLARTDSGTVRVVIADFGIARALVAASADSAETVSGFQVGSPHSMAPEQLTSDSVDERTDVYAMGVLLFRLVTGDHPFQADTPLATAVQRLHVPPPSARSRLRTVPRNWDQTIHACLQREKERRPRTVLEVLERLERRSTPGKKRAAVLLMAVLAGLAAMTSWKLRHPAPPPISPIAVMPLHIQPSTPGSVWEAEAMRAMLEAELKASATLRVLDGESIRVVSAASPTPGPEVSEGLRRIRSLLGAEIAIIGRLTGGAEPGSEVRLDVEARETRTGRVLGTFSDTATTRTLGTLASRAGNRLRILLGGGGLSPEQVVSLQASRPQTEQALHSYSEALRFKEVFELEHARASFERASREDPSFLPSRLELIAVLLDLGRVELARPLAHEAVALATSVSEEMRLRAEALFQRAEGNADAASALYKRLVDLHPASVEDLLQYADAAPAENTLESIQRLRRTHGELAGDPRLELQEAVAHMALRSPEEALKVLAPAETRARTSGASLLLAKVRALQGQALLWLYGQSPEARAALLESETGFRVLGRSHELAGVLLFRGYADARGGHSDDAIALFEAAAKMEEEVGNYTEVHSALADEAGQQARAGKVREALETVRRAEHAFELAGDRGFPKELAELGNVELLGGRLREARRWFERAQAQEQARIFQPAPALPLYLGILEREEDHAEASRHALEMIASNSYLALERAAYLAILDCEERQWSQGLERIRAAAALKSSAFPNSRALAETAEARCALAASDVAEAEKHARGALELVPASSSLNTRVQPLLVLAELEAANGTNGAAVAELASLTEVLKRNGAKRSELDARLGLVNALVRLSPREGRVMAAQLAEEAHDLGFRRIERRVRGLLTPRD